MNDLYIITTLSNMHVGSGEVTFGVIDNLIQRDVLYNYPNINSSGLKGAIREFFKNYYRGKDVTETIKRIFGSSPNHKEQQGDELSPGSFRFFEANILSIPVRSDKAPYFMATCKNVIDDFCKKMEVFGIKNKELEIALKAAAALIAEKGKPLVFDENHEGAMIEDTEFKAVNKKDILSVSNLSLLKKIFGDRLTILNDDDFVDICSDKYLPVIARNNLEDGKSQNLWYEQVLPRESRLSFVLMKGNEDDGKILDGLFAENLVQIGANASIGYGFTKIKPIAELLK